jgi:hypothetical protein
MLRRFSLAQLQSLEYRNEAEYAKLKPTKENPKETSYIKNNPREKDISTEDGPG